MGWLSVLIGIVAALLFWNLGSRVFFVMSVISSIGAFWSWGIMHNYATESAKRRSSYTGGFYDFSETDINSIPNWISTINMVITIIAFILLIVAIVMKIF